MNNKFRFPDFIIAGAMKAGTTSMRHILNGHDNIFIPQREIYFFDMDDGQQHPDFFMDDRGEWAFPDYEHHYKDYLDWYCRFFQNASDEQVIGEDSTTYMASNKAPCTNRETPAECEAHFHATRSSDAGVFSLLALRQERPCHLRLRRHLTTYTWYHPSARLLQRAN